MTVPYACLFTYECIKHYLPEKILTISNYYNIVGVLLITFGLLNYERLYTFTIFILAGLVWIIFVTEKQLFSSRNYWLYIALSLIGFIAVNMILTGIPIVIYNPEAILGIRIGSIPIEDFCYFFIMNTAFLYVYLKFEYNAGSK